MGLEQEVSRTLNSEVLGVLFLAKSPVTSQSSDKCSSLVSLASSSSFIFTQRKPCPESTFLHDRVSSLCLGPLSQGTEGRAFKFRCLVPNPATSSTHPGSSLHQLGADRPTPCEDHAGVDCSPLARWGLASFGLSRAPTPSHPPAAGCLSQLQVERGSAVSTGGFTLQGRALHIASRLTIASSSGSKGGSSRLMRKYGPICAPLTYGSN